MNDLLTVQEVVDILRVDVATVRCWIKSGVLEAVSLPYNGIRNVYRIKRETLEKLLEGALPE